MEIQWLEVLKWVGIALAAGFIGYFGRYFAMLIIDRMHKQKPQETKQAPPSQASTLEESRIKLEKKKAKAEAKRIKKEGKQ